MKRRIIVETFRIISILSYLIGGLVVVFALNNSEYIDMLVLGIILLSIGFIETIAYFATKKYQVEHCHALLFSIASMALGLIFITGDNNYLDLETGCLLWGLLEIFKGLFELYSLVYEVKEQKYRIIIDAISAIVSIVFGVLLCVHQVEGIEVHLVVTASLLFSQALLNTLRFYIFNKVKIHEKD